MLASHPPAQKFDDAGFVTMEMNGRNSRQAVSWLLSIVWFLSPFFFFYEVEEEVFEEIITKLGF